MTRYPQDTLLGMYQQLQEPTETAAAYDLWCGLWLISLACGRDIYIDRPHARVFMNMYVILVADSGITRKSSAVDRATTLAHVCLEGQDNTRIIEGKMTAETLCFELGEISSFEGTGRVVIAVSELATVLGTETYARTLPTLLTDLYDCPARRHIPANSKRKAYDLRNVWVSFLSASTPAWLLKTVNPTVMEGGFTSRCYFILGDKPKNQVAWPEARDDKRLTDAIVTKWREIQRKVHEHKVIGISEKAKEYFVRWYGRRRLSSDPFRSSFESREDSHALRLAGLFCINDDTWIIQHQHIVAAVKLITEVKESGATLFEPVSEQTDWLLATDCIRTMLIEAGASPIARAVLYRAVRRHITNEQFTVLITTLHEMLLIQRFNSRDIVKRAGRPTELIRATTAFLAPQALTAVNQRVRA